jgi:hypothetical protein
MKQLAYVGLAIKYSEEKVSHHITSHHIFYLFNSIKLQHQHHCAKDGINFSAI